MISPFDTGACSKTQSLIFILRFSSFFVALQVIKEEQ